MFWHSSDAAPFVWFKTSENLMNLINFKSSEDILEVDMFSSS